jgi:hypothetical protein
LTSWGAISGEKEGFALPDKKIWDSTYLDGKQYAEFQKEWNQMNRQ